MNIGSKPRIRLFARDHLVSMLAAPMIWAVHFVLSYLLASLACSLGWSELRFAGLPLTQSAIMIVTLAALVLLGVAAADNLGKRRRAIGAGATDAGDAAGAVDANASTGGRQVSVFIATSALLLCLLSALAVLWVAFPALLLPPCGS